MTRKIVAALIGLVGLAVLGALVYFAWNFIQTGSLFGGLAEQPSPAEQPAGPFTAVSPGPVFDYFPTQNGILVIKESGEVSLVQGGGESMVSPASSDQPFRASISFDKQYLLVGFGSRDFPQFSIYDVAGKIWLPLRIGAGTSPIADAVWASQGLRIAFLEKSGDQWSLGVVDFAAPRQPKGAATTTPADPLSNPSVKRHATLSILDAQLEWLLPEKVYLASVPSAFDRGFLMEYDLQKNTARLLLSNEAGLSTRWRDGGGLGVKFSLRGRTPSLVGIDGNAKTLGAIPLITLPEKCVLHETLLYCAVPSALPLGTQLPDDYHQKAFPVRDALVRASLGEGTVTTLVEAQSATLDAFRLKISGSDLFFVNDHDKKLYRMAR